MRCLSMSSLVLKQHVCFKTTLYKKTMFSAAHTWRSHWVRLKQWRTYLRDVNLRLIQWPEHNWQKRQRSKIVLHVWFRRQWTHTDIECVRHVRSLLLLMILTRHERSEQRICLQSTLSQRTEEMFNSLTSVMIALSQKKESILYGDLISKATLIVFKLLVNQRARRRRRTSGNIRPFNWLLTADEAIWPYEFYYASVRDEATELDLANTNQWAFFDAFKKLLHKYNVKGLWGLCWYSGDDFPRQVEVIEERANINLRLKDVSDHLHHPPSSDHHWSTLILQYSKDMTLHTAAWFFSSSLWEFKCNCGCRFKGSSHSGKHNGHRESTWELQMNGWAKMGQFYSPSDIHLNFHISCHLIHCVMQENALNISKACAQKVIKWRVHWNPLEFDSLSVFELSMSGNWFTWFPERLIKMKYHSRG